MFHFITEKGPVFSFGQLVQVCSINILLDSTSMLVL